MKLVFDLSKSLDKTKLVQVQRTVQGKHGQYQRMQWVKPSDVKDTDVVVGGAAASTKDAPTVSPYKLSYYINIPEFKEKYAKALGIPSDALKLGGRTRDSVDKDCVTFQIYDDRKHHGAHSTPQTGYDLGEIVVNTKNKTIQVRKPAFGDVSYATLEKAKKAIDDSRVGKKEDAKSKTSKAYNDEKPVNIDDFSFKDYKNPDGQNTSNRKTYRSAMKDWAEQTEKLYTRAIKNYGGETTPEKQLNIEFMNLNRESSIRDLVGNSSEDELKRARDAIYARQKKLTEMSKKYTKWDSSKREWVENSSGDSKKDIKTPDKAPDKAVGKNWSETKTELGKMGYKVDAIFSSQPPQPKEKLTLYKDGKTYEAEVTKYHNGDYEILGSSIKEVKPQDDEPKKDDSDKPKLSDPTTPTNPSDIKVGDYIYYEDNEGAGGIKGVTQVKEIKKVVVPKTGKTLYVFNEHGRHDRVSCVEGKTVKKYDSKQDTKTTDSGDSSTDSFKYKVGDKIKFDSNFRGVNPKIGTGEIVSISNGVATKDDKNPSKVIKVKGDNGNTFNIDENMIIEDSDDKKTDTKSTKFSMTEFSGMKSDRTKAIQYLKDNGISWKETDNEGINWMRACMAASRAENPAQGATKKDSASKSSSDMKASGKSTEEAKKAVKDLLSANNNDRAKVMQIAKASGVTWKESDNDGINWMRASLAIQKHHESGKTISISDSDDKKDDTKTDDKPSAKKVSISDLKRPASNNSSTNLVAGDYKITVHKFRNVGANAKQHPSFYHISVEKDGDNVFRTDKTDWSDIKYHAQRYIDAASSSDSKSDRDSDSTSGVKQLKPANISTRDEFDIHSKVRKGELSKTPIGDSDKEMIKNIVPNYKSVLKESDTKCVAYSKNREYRFTKLSDSHFKCEVYEISNKKDTSRPIKTSWYETK